MRVFDGLDEKERTLDVIKGYVEICGYERKCKGIL